MIRYKVYDYYDFIELLCETDDLNEAYAAALMRINDTDGECSVVILDTSIVSTSGAQSVPIEFYGED